MAAGFVSAAHDEDLGELAVLVGLQELVVVLQRYAAVRGTGFAEQIRMGKDAVTAVHVAIADRLHAQRAHAMKRLFAEADGIDVRRCDADILAVEGDPTRDVRLLQDKKKLKMVMKDGRIHTPA